MAWRGVASSWSRVPAQADGSLCFQLLAIATATPTQADLLRLLSMICRHFAACAFSIRVTRSFDAVRLVVVACLATLADALMRIRASDVPSLLCLSYCGAADGPGEPVRTPRLYTLYFIPYSPSLCVLPVSRTCSAKPLGAISQPCLQPCPQRVQPCPQLVQPLRRSTA